MRHWQQVRLRDVSTVITKGTTPTTLGYPFTEAGINFVKSESISTDGRIDRSKFAFIDEATNRVLKRSILAEEDILFSMAGVFIGKTAVVPREILPANTNQAVGIIRLDRSKADPHFVDYHLRNRTYNKFINNLVAQSAQPNLNLAEIGNLPLALPPLEEQRAIAQVLGALDNKIELNQRMNETLEATAQAIFRSWFIDFLPIRSKPIGQTSNAASTYGFIFPDGFQPTGIGEIPDGWTVTSVYDCATFINGVAFSKVHFSLDGSGLPIVKIAELKDGVTAQTKFTNGELAGKYKIRDGEILFAWSGSPDTSIDTFVWAGGDAWLNQHIFKVEFYSPHEKLFVYYLLKHLKPTFIEIARDKQTTGLGHVTAQDLKRLKVAFPSPAVLEAFQRVVEPLFERSFQTLTESRTLAALRDALLPKLLSGKLQVRPETLSQEVSHA
ncbi:MAG: restriction endonuclease subunit S [Pyrinomonadaceae bacterium]